MEVRTIEQAKVRLVALPNKAGTYGGQPVQTSGEEVLIDVSHHQGTIDWAKVPYRALVRIGYRGYGSGALMKDEQFNANLAGAKANNKLLGFYFFSQAITEDEARAEADFCASLAPTGYPLFFDSEWGHTTKTGVHDGRADNLTKAQRTACARAFSVYVRRRWATSRASTRLRRLPRQTSTTRACARTTLAGWPTRAQTTTKRCRATSTNTARPQRAAWQVSLARLI